MTILDDQVPVATTLHFQYPAKNVIVSIII